jgi:hypothetical protein
MDENNLKIWRIYFSKTLGKLVKYIGLQTCEGKVYHNFYEPVMKLFHWLDPEDVELA